MHCISQYPCEDKNIGINILKDYLKNIIALSGILIILEHSRFQL